MFYLRDRFNISVSNNLHTVFRCFCYRCFCLSLKSLYVRGLNGMFEKCVNTSFFPSCNRHSGQCVIMLTARAESHTAAFRARRNWPIRVSLESFECFYTRGPFDNLIGPFWNPRWDVCLPPLSKERNLCRHLPCTVITLRHSINWNIREKKKSVLYNKLIQINVPNNHYLRAEVWNGFVT